VYLLCSSTCNSVRHMQVMWEVLGLLVRHQGRLKSSAPPAKKDDSTAEAQLAAVLVSRSEPCSCAVNFACHTTQEAYVLAHTLSWGLHPKWLRVCLRPDATEPSVSVAACHWRVSYGCRKTEGHLVSIVLHMC